MKSARRRGCRRRHQNKNYIYVLVAAATVIMIGAAGATLAYLSRQSGLVNQFALGEVRAEVEETFDSGNALKESVSVRNTGTVPAYIRASINVYWQDAEGNILWGTPVMKTEEGTDGDYAMTLNLDTKGADGGEWVLGQDGFYYYTKPVAATDTSDPDANLTEILIERCQELNIEAHKQEGKFLVVDIAAQALQAEPDDAVLDAWTTVTSVSEDGSLTVSTAASGGGTDTPGGGNG